MQEHGTNAGRSGHGESGEPAALAGEIAGCLEQIASGNLRARDRVFELCSERLHLLARRMLRDYPRVRRWSDTDDIFQAAAMRLHRALAQTQPESVRGLLALAGTQMHRELVDLARHYSSQGSYEANHGTNIIGEDDSGRPQHAIDQVAARPEPLDRWSTFHEAVESLAPNDREVFDLVWYMGASQETAATVIGCSTRTVRARWRRAKTAVRSALDDRSPEG